MQIRFMVRIAAVFSGMTEDEITGKRHYRLLARPRQAVYLVAAEQGFSTPLIGRCIGGRDHSTVVHGIAVARDMLTRDPVFAELVELLRATAADYRTRRLDAVRDCLAGLSIEQPAPPVSAVTLVTLPGGEAEDERLPWRERASLSGIARGTHDLLVAIARAHPERMVA
jgi:hypothetical protein